MRNKSLKSLSLLTITLVSFFLGVFFMKLAIENGAIHVSGSNHVKMNVNLAAETEKVLVPKGYVNSPYETEEVHLTYKVVTKNLFVKKRLNASISSVVDENGEVLNSYLTGTEQITTYIKWSGNLTFKIGLITPSDVNEYDQVAAKQILLTIEFWLD